MRNKDPDDIAGDTEFFDRGEARDERYWQKIKALVAHLLKRKPAPRLRRPPIRRAGRTIYVAKPASDMRAGYDRIVCELVGRRTHRGSAADGAISRSGRRSTAIDKALCGRGNFNSSCSARRPAPRRKTSLPMVKLQLAHAADKAGNDAERQVPPAGVGTRDGPTQPATGLSPRRRPQRHPVDVLARFDRQLPTDKVEGDSLSKFVDFINQHLAAIAPPRLPSWIAAAGKTRRDIAAISTTPQEDSDYALSLAQALQQRQLDALLPVFDGPDAEIKSFNGKQLAQCDAVILVSLGLRIGSLGSRPGERIAQLAGTGPQAAVFLSGRGRRCRHRAAGRKPASCCSRAATSIWWSTCPTRMCRQRTCSTCWCPPRAARPMNAPVQLARQSSAGASAFPACGRFAYQDHDYFFGRSDQTYALYRLIDRSRFVAVVGSSGSGKSSLVRAGLLPLLDQRDARHRRA